jgi:hypothetical protein
MIKYKTIKNYVITEFDREVSKHLNDGWQITGGISVTVNLSNEALYFVGMTKTEVEEKETNQTVSPITTQQRDTMLAGITTNRRYL